MQPPGKKPSEDSAATTDRAARYRPALAAATALFFIWGFLTSLNDILIPHLKGVFDLGYAGGAFVQLSFFSAYSWCRSRPARSSRRSVTSVASCSGSPSPGLARCSSIPRRAVQWLAEHTGLIRFEGTGDDEQIRFWHRLFREYLAARQLARQDKVVRVLVDELWESNCLVDPFWGDVIQLLPRALGTSEKVLSLIQGLQELAAAHAPARGRLLGLAAACMIESRDLFPGVNFASQAKDLARAYESEGLTWALPDRQLVLGKLALLTGLAGTMACWCDSLHSEPYGTSCTRKALSQGGVIAPTWIVVKRGGEFFASPETQTRCAARHQMDLNSSSWACVRLVLDPPP